jgi:hypothetical protein
MPVPFIAKLIAAEIELGQVVDVEKHCKVLHVAFPHLSHKDIQNIIIEVVAARRGGAAWGSNGLEKPEGAS